MLSLNMRSTFPSYKWVCILCTAWERVCICHRWILFTSYTLMSPQNDYRLFPQVVCTTLFHWPLHSSYVWNTKMVNVWCWVDRETLVKQRGTSGLFACPSLHIKHSHFWRADQHISIIKLCLYHNVTTATMENYEKLYMKQSIFFSKVLSVLASEPIYMYFMKICPCWIYFKYVLNKSKGNSSSS